MSKLNQEIIEVIKKLYPKQGPVPLHEPQFDSNEKELLLKCIDSTFVSSVGAFVGEFESMVAKFTGIKHAVATVNGTAALHIGLLLADVRPGDEVITQALTFVATANSIQYCSARPIFIDSDPATMGMCPEMLEAFLKENTERRKGGHCYNKNTGARIKACVPMHVFGHPCKIKRIAELCIEFNLFLIEDSAEALGSRVDEKHVGKFGGLSVLSFNGNKIITSGGGGMILTDDEDLARRAKHLTTTAKIPHPWEFIHDEVGFNYRLPNLNAALACAQMGKLESFIEDKRNTAQEYQHHFRELGVESMVESKGTRSNYWLNAILFRNKEEKASFLEHSNAQGIMTRPLWKLMPHLEMYSGSQHTNLKVAMDFYDRLVNIPSSVRPAHV